MPVHTLPTPAARIAVIGAGWAGCAAAVRATQLGARVTIFEASRSAGGRARSVPCAEADGGMLDNGQHILIGAYTQTLALMRTIGASPDALLQRLPLGTPLLFDVGVFLTVLGAVLHMLFRLLEREA